MNGTTTFQEGEVTIHLMRRYVASLISDSGIVAHNLEVQLRDHVGMLAKELIIMHDLPIE